MDDLFHGGCRKLAESLTLEEKARLVCGGGNFKTAELARAGIPGVLMADGPVGLRLERTEGGEGLAGVPEMYRTYPATLLPCTASLANTFDRELAEECGELLGRQCREFGVGMLLAPGINLKRDALCGRNFEYYSEDPYLTGELASRYVRGVQSTGTAACVKHFACNNRENARLTTDSVLSERTLREVYLDAFERVVKTALPAAVMPAYNRVNGEYCCCNSHLLRDVLRKDWGFEGITVSDWGAADGRAECLLAGLDLEMPDSRGEGVRGILSAGDSSELTEACARLIAFAKTYGRMGETSPKVSALSEDTLRRGHELAVRAASLSMVLLENDGILPLAQDSAVVFAGGMLQNPRIQGAGSAKVNPAVFVPVEQALSRRFPGAEFYLGFDAEGKPAEDSESFLSACRRVKAAVLFVGIPESEESEGFDRSDFTLPLLQRKRIQEALETGCRVVLVVSGGGAVDLNLGRASGLIWAGLAGEGFGEAIASVLSGDCNPSGRLAETFPARREDNCAYLGRGERTVVYGEGIFVGYRYSDALGIRAGYPFGAGLSYTQFHVEDFHVERTADSRVRAGARIVNTGSAAGRETVLFFVSKPTGSIAVPVKQLAGFESKVLQPGESARIETVLDERAFFRFDEAAGSFVRDGGVYRVSICRDAETPLLSAELKLAPVRGGKLRCHRNMTFRDILDNAGEEVLEELVKDFQRVSGNSLDPRTVENELVRKIIWDHPLRALISLYAGEYTLADLQKWIDKRNGEEI